MTPGATTWSVAGLDIDITQGALVGVLNVTPDSFSDGGMFPETEMAVSHGLEMVAEGAEIVDVGGESTRPGASTVPAEEEMRRALPVVSALAERGVVVSIDTRKPDVAAAALDAGAVVVNDVSGFDAKGMVDVVASSDCGVVIVHGRGGRLDELPLGSDPVDVVREHLIAKMGQLVAAGVDGSRIALDPGVGFAKRPEQSLAILGGVARLAAGRHRVMIGSSRKGFLARAIGTEDWTDRDDATAATTALGYLLGARLFRVHDVRKSAAALRIAAAIVENQ